MAVNGKTITNAIGKTGDWIEIHNTSAGIIDLSGLYLTDDALELNKWQFPSTNITANGYLLVWADNQSSSVISNELHTNFKLSGSGEYLALTDSNGTAVLHEYAPQFPAQKKDISYGILTNQQRFFASPTPGASNSNAFDGFTADTKFSHDRGFYTNAFDVSITCSTTGAVIRYTLNGDTPTEITGTIYTNPIHITGSTILRAIAYKPGFKASDADTQTYLYIAGILKQDGSGLRPYANWGHAGPDWELDPTMTNTVITDSSGISFGLADALTNIPTVSLVTDWDNWWSEAPGPVLPDGLTPWLGIYADKVGESAVHRPVSMEFFTADGKEQFALNASVHIVGGGIGGTSANRWKTDKLSMRIAFKDEYGSKRLNYPVFGKNAAGTFKTLVMDAHMNWTWTHSGSSGQRSAAKFLQDAFVSDLQNSISDNNRGAPHSRFVHLYLNGLYWGMYDMHERPDEDFAETYFGGNSDDYDSVKHVSDDTASEDSDHDGNRYNDNITNGDDADLRAMISLSRKDMAIAANYNAVAAVLDIDAFIDYMLPNFYAGNNDWAHKNWYATRNRIHSDGKWRYHSWDAEHVLEAGFSNPSISGALNLDVTGKDNSGGPTEVHQNLKANPEYRLIFSDHIQRHFFNNGTLTPQKAAAIFQSRMDEIEWAVLGEAARWADNSEPHTYYEWLNHMTDIKNNYLPYRSAKVVNQLKNRNLFPDTIAPEIQLNGTNSCNGLFSSGDLLSFQSSNTVYYTLDGRDPRQALTGTPVGTEYNGSPFVITYSVHIKARARSAGGEWSPLSEALLTLDELPPLQISELMYHPRREEGSVTNWAASEFEFIELHNPGTDTIGLAGIYFSDGIRFDFSKAVFTTLAPGAYLLIVNNLTAFTNRYPAVDTSIIAGEFQYTASFSTPSLSNSGEHIGIKDAQNRKIISFSYDTSRGWPLTADGAGHALVPRIQITGTANELSYSKNWRAGTYRDGSPGTADPEQFSTILLNEIAAHTDYSDPAHPEYDSNDWIELFNTGTSSVTLADWYLSDDIGKLKKWAIPGTNVISSADWIVFDEVSGFHSPITTGFGINKAGEQVFLSYLPGTAQDRVADALQFKGQENGLTTGRYADGNTNWMMTVPTRDTANSLTAPNMVISEIIYHPLPTTSNPENNTNDEYIELHNQSLTNIPLWTVAGTWRINGEVEYIFPSNTTILASEHIRLVSFDPQTDLTARSQFLAAYHLTNGQFRLFGPFSGKLSNSNGRVALERPQEPDLPGDSISWVIVDEAFYYNSAPVDISNPYPGRTPITNGLYLELIADDLNLTNGSAITSWVDTISSNELVQSEAGAASFNADFTNGHASVHFSGSGNLKDNTLEPAGLPDTDNATLFLVAKPITFSGGAQRWLFRAQNSGDERLRIVKNSNQTTWSTRVGGGSGISTATPVSSDLSIFTVVSGKPGTNDVHFSRNGTEIGSGSSGTGQTIGLAELGENFNTDIAEILLYNRTLSDREITEINNYLKTKYIAPPVYSSTIFIVR